LIVFIKALSDHYSEITYFFTGYFQTSD